MRQWEYCILSGVETSLKRRLALSLTFSNKIQANKNVEIELDCDRSEEMFTSQYLGELGRDGWEMIAFNRVAQRFEAVLKRPCECNDLPLQMGSMSLKLQS